MINLTLPKNLILLVLISCSACSSNVPTAAEEQTTVYEVSDQPLTAQPAEALLEHSNIEYMRIKHHMVECEGFEVDHCFVAQKEGSDEWVYVYESIEGFDYQWGVEYEILVQAQEIDSGFADALSLRYTLLEVVSETQHEASEAFQYLSRKPHERIVEIAPGQFSLLNNKIFTCTSDTCGALRSAIDQEHSALLSFRQDVDPSMPMVLDAVLCNDAAESFSASCL